MSTHDEFPFAETVKEEKKWDAISASKKDWFATIFIFLLPPLGLYFLWRDRVYWRRSGKTVVVSNGRKFILSIPAVLIMLIGITIATGHNQTVTDSSEAVTASTTPGVPANKLAAYQARFDVWFNQCQQATRNQIDAANGATDDQVTASLARDRCVTGMADIRPFAVGVMGERCGTAIDTTRQMLDGVRMDTAQGLAMASAPPQSEAGMSVYRRGLARHDTWLREMRACGIDAAAMGVE